jgi:hypothetical protein
MSPLVSENMRQCAVLGKENDSSKHRPSNHRHRPDLRILAPFRPRQSTGVTDSAQTEKDAVSDRVYTGSFP